MVPVQPAVERIAGWMVAAWLVVEQIHMAEVLDQTGAAHDVLA